ncbi:MAG: HAMP domain-containing sensor histidine kinase [Minisyncoccia bacterium]
MDANSCYLGTVGLRELALYSHLIPALATLVLGLFAFSQAGDRVKASIFFAFSITFSLWLFADMFNWISNNYFLVAATWAPLDYINIVFFLLLFYFVFIDLSGRTVPWWLAGAVLTAAGIPFFITATGNSVYEFNQPVCEMLGNDFLANYKLAVELSVLALTFVLGIIRVAKSWRNDVERIRATLIAGSIVLFMGVFSIAEYQSVATEVYEIMLYALFTLPIFILILTLAITSYGTFKLGDATVRVLFYVFLILAATQFFFVSDTTEFLLAGMSFGVVLTLGLMLFRASEREMRQRMRIEKQEQDLEIMNKQQQNLLHFISHEVKGFLTEGQNAFASIVEGDLGSPTPQIRDISQTALGKMRQGVRTVMEILDASNLKQGTMSYKRVPFDFREALESVTEHMRSRAAEQGLTLDVSIDATKTYNVTGDKDKIAQHVIRNLIDNSIRYTPKGNVHIALVGTDGHVRFSVKDTGVGITPEDMQHLFTEGGHGKESIKVNVDSTGYGLFVAKQVIEAHGGKIWAESAGPGKGSEFIVELPSI